MKTPRISTGAQRVRGGPEAGPPVHRAVGLRALDRFPWAESELGYLNMQPGTVLAEHHRLAPALQSHADAASVFNMWGELLKGGNHAALVRLTRAERKARGGTMLTTEFHDGRTLLEVILACHDRGTAFPLPLLAHVMVRATEGLVAMLVETMEGRGTRALPAPGPDGVWVGYDGSVKVSALSLMDLPMSQAAGQADEPVGALAYQSPEFVQLKRAEERSIVFSLGIILYECLTHALPFWADSAAGIARAISRASPVPPREINPAIPVAVERLCLQAMSRTPANRPTVGEFLDGLRAASRVSGAAAAGASHLGVLMELLFPPRDAVRAEFDDLRQRVERLHVSPDDTGERTVPMLQAPPPPRKGVQKLDKATPGPQPVKGKVVLREPSLIDDPEMVTEPTRPSYPEAERSEVFRTLEATQRVKMPGDASDEATLRDTRAMMEASRQAAESTGFWRTSGTREGLTWGRLAIRGADNTERTRGS